MTYEVKKNGALWEVVSTDTGLRVTPPSLSRKTCIEWLEANQINTGPKEGQHAKPKPRKDKANQSTPAPAPRVWRKAA